jgi:hypothetical protein
MKKSMTKIIKITGQILITLVLLDLMILFFSMAQIAVEDKTGYWNPFWRWQAEQVIRLMK